MDGEEQSPPTICLPVPSQQDQCGGTLGDRATAYVLIGGGGEQDLGCRLNWVRIEFPAPFSALSFFSFSCQRPPPPTPGPNSASPNCRPLTFILCNRRRSLAGDSHQIREFLHPSSQRELEAGSKGIHVS